MRDGNRGFGATEIINGVLIGTVAGVAVVLFFYFLTII